MKLIDSILNRLTMYQVVLYGLFGLLTVAEIFAITGTISISPIGLPLTGFLLFVSSYATDTVVAKLLRLPHNYESWMITGMIMACVLFPVDDLATGIWVLLGGVIATLSKYFIKYRGMHIFNPAAFGIFVVSLVGEAPAGWWMATPAMTPFTVLVGLAILRKQREFKLFGAFAFSALAMLLLIGVGNQGQTASEVLRAAVYSWPIIFFGTIMLTEPQTMPTNKFYRYIFVVLVGCLFSSQLHVGSLSTTPQAVLLLGNLFALIVTPASAALLRLHDKQQLTPDTFRLRFKKAPGRLAFRAGQYMDFTLSGFKEDARGNRRAFSAASSPNSEFIDIIFRQAQRSSAFKTAALAMKPGDTIRVSRARGDFTLPARNEPLLFIAGGIGITPFISMISYLLAKNTSCDILLLYMSAADDYVYADLFKQVESIGVKTQYVHGRLQASELSELIPDIQQRLVYISGPDAMVTSYKQLVTGLGLQRSRIKTDHFTGY